MSQNDYNSFNNLRNLQVLQDFLPQKCQPFVDTLISIRNLDDGVSGHLLDSNFPNLIKEFSSNWMRLKREFEVPITNKVHILCDHLEDFLKLTNVPLGLCSDQVIERIHQQLHQRFSCSNYSMKALTHPRYIEKFERGILHYNAYNVNIDSFDDSC